MIEIVRHGKNRRLYFVCKKCGCVFWADGMDYWHSGADEHDWYSCHCPECDMPCVNGGDDDVGT